LTCAFGFWQLTCVTSFYAGDNRLLGNRDGLKPTPGYCIFIDMADSVALMEEQGLWVWVDTMYNIISPAMAWLRDLDQKTGNVESDSSFVKPTGLPPLKIIGDCLMFYIPMRSMPQGADALTIFDALLNVIRVPMALGSDVRPELHVAVTWCEHAFEVTFEEQREDIHGNDINLAARLVKEAGPQELVMNAGFYLRVTAPS